MGLTKEVRDFFGGRIRKVLDAKIAELNKNIDVESMKQEAIRRLCDFYGSPTLPARIKTLQEHKVDVEREEQEIRHLIHTILLRSNVPNSYWGNAYDQLETGAVKKYYDQIVAERHPDAQAQLEKLNKMQEDIQGVILLATSEKKLVETLTKVLQNYGGEITELLDLIPK